MNFPKLAIIILNWNGWQDTIECLEYVRQLTYPNYLTVVVDNGSLDESVKEIKMWAEENLGEDHVLIEYTREDALQGGEEKKEDALEEVASPKAKLVLIKNEENLGFTGGNNVAIHYAIHRKYSVNYVFLLNNDTKVEKNSLIYLVEADRRANAGIVGGALVREGTTGKAQFSNAVPKFLFLHKFFSPIFWFFSPIFWSESQEDKNDELKRNWGVEGVAMLIRVDVLKAVYNHQGFYLNPVFFGYADELEFIFRATKYGYKSIVIKQVVVYHKGARSFGGKCSPLSCYYSTRNRIFLAKNTLPWGVWVIFCIFNPLVWIVRFLKNRNYRQPRVMRAILCGLIDGYAGVGGIWNYHNREALKVRTSK